MKVSEANLRIDHIAYRVKCREKTAKFFIDAFGYKIQTRFPILFDNGETANCIALEPPEKVLKNMPWIAMLPYNQRYHLAPEIFISDGTEGSIVGEWVKARNGIGGIHHIALQVEDVQAIMDEWKQKGYAEFSSETPIVCEAEGLTQVFTKPSELTGVVYEFIKREAFGFCQENVKSLMLSSADTDYLVSDS